MGQQITLFLYCFYTPALITVSSLRQLIYLVKIQGLEQVIGGICGVLNRKQRNVFEETQVAGNPLFIIKACLANSEPFGFAADLSSHTSGQAFLQGMPECWQILFGDFFENTSHLAR